MAVATYFVQECPTCGRRLQVRIEYLGKKIACRHCQAKFTASDPASGPVADVDSDSSIAVLARADRLIEAAQSGIFGRGQTV